MSTVVRPSGRLPARVYWVRRGLLLLLVLLLAWGLARCAANDPSAGAGRPGPADDSSPADDTAGATADPARSARADGSVATAGIGASVSTSPLRSVDGRRSRTASRPQRVRPVLSAPVGRCDPAATTVTPSAGDPVVSGSGALLQLRLAVSGEQACTLPFGERLLVQVALEGESVWSLEDCPSAVSTESVVLRPGWASVVDVAWSGRGSSATCPVETAAVRPGTYQLQAAMLGGEPGTVDLEVVAPPESRPKGQT